MPNRLPRGSRARPVTLARGPRVRTPSPSYTPSPANSSGSGSDASGDAGEDVANAALENEQALNGQTDDAVADGNDGSESHGVSDDDENDSDQAMADAEDDSEMAQLKEQLAAAQEECERLRQVVNLAEGKNKASYKTVAAAASKPDQFDGRGNVRDWIYQMSHYLTVIGAPKASAVGLAVGFLRGEAMRHWFANVTPLTAQGQTCTDWEVFKQCMFAAFDVADPEHKARTALDTLAQKGPIEKYLRQFNSLTALITDMTDGEKIHRFLAGLNASLRDKVKVDPTTRQRWRKFAMLADFAVHQGADDSISAATDVLKNATAPRDSGGFKVAGGVAKRHKAAGSAPRGGPRANTTTGASGSGTRQPKEYPGVPARSAAVRDHCFRKGLCLKCYKPGHRMADCTSVASQGIPDGFRE